MRVAYFTPNATAVTQCAYGTSPSSLASVSMGSAKNYLPDAGYHHTIKLSNLTVGTTYYYACGDGSPANTSATYSFVQPSPAAPSPGQTFSTLIFADMGWLDSKRAGGPMLPVGGLDSNWSATLTREMMASLQAQGAFEQVLRGEVSSRTPFSERPAPRVLQAWIVGDIAYADDAFGHIDYLLRFGYEDVYNGGFLRARGASARLDTLPPALSLPPPRRLDELV